MMGIAIVAFLIQPLTFVYLKQTLDHGVSTVQTVATFGIAGSIVGYLIFGKLLKLLGSKRMLLTIHAAFLRRCFYAVKIRRICSKLSAQ